MKKVSYPDIVLRGFYTCMFVFSLICMYRLMFTVNATDTYAFLMIIGTVIFAVIGLVGMAFVEG